MKTRWGKLRVARGLPRAKHRIVTARAARLREFQKSIKVFQKFISSPKIKVEKKSQKSLALKIEINSNGSPLGPKLGADKSHKLKGIDLSCPYEAGPSGSFIRPHP